MSDAPVTARAAELAERILDEVSALDQDWRTIASCSRELGDLARAAADRPPRAGTGDLARAAASFRGLAHPTRLRILEALRESEPLSPAQLTHRLEPRIPLGSVAHHMRELAKLGVVALAAMRPARGALEHFYRLSPFGRELIELVDRVVAPSSAGG
jgi:DNA-binding transcriptional ArsR family regulator